MDSQHQTEQINELSAALAKAQSEMELACKDADNPFYKSRYADLSACIKASRPHLSKHGLSITQVTEFDEAGNVTLVTQIMHSSGQWIRGWYPIRPVKNDPQGMGSAFTYGRRYTYCGITGVVATDEDDDGNDASGKGHGAATQPKPKTEPAPTKSEEAPKPEAKFVKAVTATLVRLGCKSPEDASLILEWATAGEYTDPKNYRASEADAKAVFEAITAALAKLNEPDDRVLEIVRATKAASESFV